MQPSPDRLVRGLSLVVIPLAALALGGCGRAVGTVSGKVSYNGKTLKGGNVTFVSTEGQPTQSAGINEDGTYTIKTITAGSYKVCVETASLKPKSLSPSMGASGPPGGAKNSKLDPDTKVPEGYHPSNMAEASIANANAKNAKLYIAIPDQYADTSKTTLTYTVVGGAQTHDIELK
jgi:hypothetical protein